MSLASREPSPSFDSRHAGASTRSRALDGVNVVELVRSRWRLFRNVALGFMALVVLVLLVLPSSYSTSAVIMVEPRKNTVTDESSVLSETPTDPASIQNQIQLLTSRDLASNVVDKLGLARDPEFATQQSSNPLDWLAPPPVRDPVKRHDALVTAFLKHLSVEAVGLSTTIKVTFSAREPEKAALITDTVVDTYLDMDAAIKFDVTQRTTDWLLDRIRQLGQQAQSAEAGIQRYKAENALNDTPNGGSLLDQQLAAINIQLVGAREDLAAKEAQNTRIVSLMQSGHAADVSQIVASPLIIQLREQQADLISQEALLSTKYGARNPKMQAVESQSRDLDAKIKEEVDRLAGSMQNEVAVARAQVNSLQASLQAAERQAADQNMARVKLQSLEANAASTRSMYESFVSRLRETQGQDGLRMVDARVISHAPVPNAPSSPPRLLIALASIPAGLLLGLLAVLFAERFEGEARPRRARAKPAPQDAFRGVTVLARVAAVAQAPDLVIDQPSSAPAQELRQLARRITAPRQGPVPKVVALTSLDRRDGQAGVAGGLARALAQLGLRVLFIDANRPAAEPGLTAVLAGTARLSQVLRKDPRSNVLILSAATNGEAARSIWSSPAAERLMAHLRQVSDIVVVNAAPIARGTALPVVAQLSDALIVVTSANGEPHPGLGAALEYVKSATALPTGLVLTR